MMNLISTQQWVKYIAPFEVRQRNCKEKSSSSQYNSNNGWYVNNNGNTNNNNKTNNYFVAPVLDTRHYNKKTHINAIL